MIFNINKPQRINILLFVFMAFNILLISNTNFQSLYSYLYTVLLFFLISKVIKTKEFFLSNLLVLNFFIFLSILLFWSQYLIIPEGFGFSGPNGVGTDDSKFFAGVATNEINIPRFAKGSIGMKHSFITFLRILYPFQITHPLTIIIPNILGICFIPYFTLKLTHTLTNNIKISNTAYMLIMFCPVLLSNSLILIRDGWTAFFTLSGVYYLIKNHSLGFVITLGLLFLIRPGSGLLLLSISILYFRNSFFKGANSDKIPRVVVGLVFFALFAYFSSSFLSEYLDNKGVSGFDRQSFVESIIKEQDANSIIYKIYTLPIYFRIPIGFVFFLFLPFYRTEVYTLDILNIRNIMFTMIMPILSLFYYKYFITGILYFFKTKDKIMMRFFYVFCFSLLIISQISIQPRHKTAIMPLFYVLVAYGIHKRSSSYRVIGAFIFVSLILIQLYFNLF
tara:strand:+ start:390 stop:1736 length:1347 start_codon:yes stop_codon:yes gene_type:complete